MNDIPEDFSPHLRKSPVTTPWEPIYARTTPDAYILGLRLAEAHTNSRGLAHGGVIAALADNAMGLSVALLDSEPRAPVTVSLAVDYLGQAKLGQWLDFTTIFARLGGTLAFADCHVHADGEVVAKASATFRLLAAR